jgi:hypothetical protein
MYLNLKQVVTTLNKTKILLLISAMSFASFSAKADYKSEIVESCQQYQAAADKDHVNACKLYIDGFIDAAVFTESATIVDEKSKKVSEERSAFMQRVYKTRSTRRISSQIDDIDYQFCLSLGEDRKIIASKIAKALNISELDSKPLKKILSETLSKAFPCAQ